MNLVMQSVLGPLLDAASLATFLAIAYATTLRTRARTLAIAGVAIAAVALSTAIEMWILTAWLAGYTRWSVATIWWANFGGGAMISVACALIYDHRVQISVRAAELRDARLRATEVVRRTAEVRMQAARARVEPRFLFDSLSAVERVYEADAAAGGRLLDNLVTYLRAVVPDLRETETDPEREAEIARLRRAIEGAIGDPPAGAATAAERA
jgi:hypothetical protein